MDLHRVFINSVGRLRSGWRLLVFLLLYVALLFLISTVVRVVYAVGSLIAPGLSPGNYVENIVYRVTLLAAALIAGLACAHWLEGLPGRTFGLSLHPGWLRDFFWGSLLGIATLTLATGIATAVGGLRFTAPVSNQLLQVGHTLVFTALLFIVAALAEEALFRGYPLQTMSRARLAWFGVLVTSVPFAVVHLRNPNVVQGFTFINTTLAGVWFATAYLRTRSLWFPLGIHWAWNWALGSIFGLPVSGITDIAPHPLLRAADLGPAWLTGGSYGIEGGVACTITLIVSTFFIWRTRLISATADLRELSSRENPVAERIPMSVVPQPNGGDV